jgi:hypothetical protein
LGNRCNEFLKRKVAGQRLRDPCFFNLMLPRKNNGGNRENFIYDPNGNMVSASTHGGDPVPISIDYDSANRPISVTEETSPHPRHHLHLRWHPVGLRG